MAETLFKLGWRSPSDLADAQAEELAAVPGLGGVEAAGRIIEAARELLVEEARRAKEEADRRAREAQKSPQERLLSVKGVGPQVVEALAKGGVTTAEQLAHQSDPTSLREPTGLSPRRLAKLSHWAKVYLGELPADAPEPELEEEAPEPEPAAAAAPAVKSEIDAGWELK